MSRSYVRSAVYNYLGSPLPPGMDYLFPGIPFDQASVLWDTVMVAGQATRCFAVIVIGESRDYGDKIFVFDGAGGRRVVPYPVTVEIYFEDIGGDPLAALTAHEAMLDAVAARMRADPSLGTPASSGLLVAATPELGINAGELERQGEGDTYAAWSTCDFSVSMYEYST